MEDELGNDHCIKNKKIKEIKKDYLNKSSLKIG